MEAEAGALVMGIDGGGSTCRARLRDGAGRLLAEAVGGSANVYLDFAGALGAIRACVASTLDRAGLATGAGPTVRLGLGLAGVSSPAIAAEVAAALPGFAAVRVSNDAVTACLGAHGGADGGLVIAGTGSAGLALIGGRETFVGGRGFVLGDDGSGARIGLDAWRRALRAHDGLEPHTAFTRGLMARFGDDPAAVIRWGLTARSADFGAEAPACFAAAAAGDAVALSIVRGAAAALAELVAAVRALGAPRVAMVGGGAAAARPYLPTAVAENLSEPVADARDGAILLAGGRLP
ncbi:BadF/BadG/BcrA/BcrD ATPase family protein [Lichenibacterium dinghuense]|uniref:BadF/BadG/BcrA/BcrD ATPase family protein n=1 Tax=Lichenibacterium dinghuense TaxID=2895977 RepID=UPI001F31D5F8|nr:BadF/BadG/BcrA/BcrD ATPase family protein [Lichenibacterium sp. 6Y81]